MNPSLIWENAIPLSDAWFRYGVPTKRARYLELCQNSSALQMVEALQECFETKNNTRVLEVSKHSSAFLSLSSEMRADALSWIKAGHLRAFGYPIPRSVEDRPVEVPADLWTCKGVHIRWEKDEIEGNGLKLAGVRLIAAQKVADLLGGEIAKAPPKKRPGRPGVKEWVQEAFDALAEAGAIECEYPKSDCYPKIKDWLLRKYPDKACTLGGLSDEAIRIHISQLFKDFCRANKQ